MKKLGRQFSYYQFELIQLPLAIGGMMILLLMAMVPSNLTLLM